MSGLGLPKADPNMDCKRILDKIEKSVYLFLKPYGFTKHGRTLHRFVSGDISQVISFQLGPSHLGQTHLLYVNVGIRVPECMLRNFEPEPELKKYCKVNPFAKLIFEHTPFPHLLLFLLTDD